MSSPQQQQRHLQQQQDQHVGTAACLSALLFQMINSVRRLSMRDIVGHALTNTDVAAAAVFGFRPNIRSLL
uniref:Uncharacterized protein n=1 Tax=Peronospora matthiolae TaxID=2874970 RepID=A0AAV1VMI9_9STRA